MFDALTVAAVVVGTKYVAKKTVLGQKTASVLHNVADQALSTVQKTAFMLDEELNTLVASHANECDKERLEIKKDYMSRTEHCSSSELFTILGINL